MCSGLSIFFEHVDGQGDGGAHHATSRVQGLQASILGTGPAGLAEYRRELGCMLKFSEYITNCCTCYIPKLYLTYLSF
jgi:hypothetical protein